MKFLNNTLFHNANLWKAKMQERENKKVQLSENTLIQNDQHLVMVTTTPRTVFSKADLGHDHMEANKIQELYNELEKLSFLPALQLR